MGGAMVEALLGTPLVDRTKAIRVLLLKYYRLWV